MESKLDRKLRLVGKLLRQIGVILLNKEHNRLEDSEKKKVIKLLKIGEFYKADKILRPGLYTLEKLTKKKDL